MPKYKLHGFCFISESPDEDAAKAKLYAPGDEVSFYGVPSVVMEPLDDAARKAVTARDDAREAAGLPPAAPSPFRVMEDRVTGRVAIPEDWEAQNDFYVVGLAKQLGAPNRITGKAARQYIAREVEARDLG